MDYFSRKWLSKYLMDTIDFNKHNIIIFLYDVAKICWRHMSTLLNYKATWNSLLTNETAKSTSARWFLGPNHPLMLPLLLSKHCICICVYLFSRRHTSRLAAKFENINTSRKIVQIQYISSIHRPTYTIHNSHCEYSWNTTHLTLTIHQPVVYHFNKVKITYRATWVSSWSYGTCS
jgi:hypothetical protein